MLSSPCKQRHDSSAIFYACYLLCSLAPLSKNVVYIGSTPNPQRRIRQHNGDIAGGAYKTSKKRPWEMVIVLYGFPSKFAALQFEWAWQNPHKSRHFKNVVGCDFTGKHKERFLAQKLFALSTMFHLDHYCRWPLHLHFTSQDIYQKFSKLKQLPTHVKVTQGSLSILPIIHELSNESGTNKVYESGLCDICQKDIDIEQNNDWMTCSDKLCPMIAHVICLSRRFLESEKSNSKSLIPLHGHCPCCEIVLKWGYLVNALKLRSIVPITPNSLADVPKTRTFLSLDTVPNNDNFCIVQKPDSNSETDDEFEISVRRIDIRSQRPTIKAANLAKTVEID